MDFEERENVYREIVSQEEIAHKRDKYFDEELKTFYEEKSFDLLPKFLGELKRGKGISEDFLIKSGVLILSLDSRGAPSVFHLASQSGQFLKDYVEFLKQGYGSSDELENEVDSLVERYVKRKNDSDALKEDGSVLHLCDDLSNQLIEAVAWDPTREVALKHLVKILSGVNILDRRIGLEKMRMIASFIPEFNKTRAYIVSEMLNTMDPDHSLEIVDSMEKHICGKWINDLEDKDQKDYWKSFTLYCQRRAEAGYSNEEIFEKLFDLASQDFKYDLPEELKIMIGEQGREVDIVTLEKANLENIWFELCGNYNIEGMRDVLGRVIKFDERCEFLAHALPHESAAVCKFLAQILINDMSAGYGDDGWRDWINNYEVNFSQIVNSPSVKLIWEKMKSNPVVFGYQIAFWLASFPFSSLAEIGIDRVDLIEGAKLETDSVGLCGMAEIYMQESINLDNVVVLGKGKMLLKRQGHMTALCLEDFVINEGSESQRVFKRGCFYVPHNSQKYGRTKPLQELDIKDSWVFDRVARSGIIPLASEGLTHLADRWLELHGYKE